MLRSTKCPMFIWPFLKLKGFIAFGRKIKEDAVLPLHIIKAEVTHILETETTESAAINDVPEKECIYFKKERRCMRIIISDDAFIW